MIIKEVFQEINAVFKKNIRILLTFSLAIFVLIFAYYLANTYLDVTYLFFVIIASLIIILPMMTSISFIAKKCVANEEVDYRDFYVGHRNMMTSITLETKILSRGALFAMIGYFAATLLGGIITSFIMQQTNPEVVDGIFMFISGKVSVDELLNLINAVSWLDLALIIIDVVGLVTAGVFYVWQGKRYIFLPFICFETRFNLLAAVHLSKTSHDTIKNKFFLYNLVYVAAIALFVGAGIGLNTILVLFLEETVAHLIAAGVSCFLLALLLIYCKIGNYVIYIKYFKEEIDELYKSKLSEENKHAI